MKPTLVACFSKNQGGMEIMSITLAKLLSSEGTVYLACRKNSFIHKNAKAYGFHGEIIPFSFTFNFSPKLIYEFSKKLSFFNIKNIIYLGASELKSLYFSCVGKNINFCMFHGTTKKHSKKDFIHKIFYQLVDTHICISSHIQDNIQKLLPISKRSKITIIPTPRDVNYTPLPKPTTHIECILTARIAGGKGHIDAIKACEANLDKNLILRFIGYSEDIDVYNQILSYIETSPMKKNIFIHGHTQDLSEFYKNAHILLLPSQGEGLSMSTIEALMYNVLPITYNNTVFPEFLTQGFDFPQAKDQDIKDLSEKLKIAIETYSNWKPKIETNRVLSKKLFSFESVRQKYLEILNKQEPF